MVFVGAKPDFWCNQSALHITINTSMNTSRGLYHFINQCEQYNQSEIVQLGADDNVSYTAIPDVLHNLTTTPCHAGAFNFSSILVCSRDWMRSTSKVIYFSGRLVGAVVFGQLSDRYGRKPMFFIGLTFLLVIGCTTSVAPNVYVFMPSYFFQGAAQTGLFLVAYTMCTELVGPNYRLLAGFLSQSFYSVGYMSLAGIAYGVRDWRDLELVITIPNKQEEAKKIIRKVARTNNVKLDESMLGDIQVKKDPECDTDGKKVTFVDLFRTFAMLQISLNVWFNWLINAMVYYGLSLDTDNLGGSPYVNSPFFVAGGVEIPAYIMCILLLNRVGRRRPLFATMIVGGAGCIASAFIHRNDLVWLKVSLAMVGKFGITASYGIIYLMAAELFPTVVRNIGMGISSMFARIGGMLAPYILESNLSNVWDPLPLLFLGVMSVIAGSFALFLPETAGEALPQTINDVKRRKCGCSCDGSGETEEQTIEETVDHDVVG
ncbi:hypothetical protein ScPMuIL_012835 [Solemya velum]